MEAIHSGLWILSYVAGLALAVRLWHAGLFRLYKFFFAYLLVQAAVTTITLPLGTNSGLYGWIYVVTEPLFWALFVTVVMELYGLVFRQHPGIASLGRWAVTGGLFLALIVSALTLPLGTGGAEHTQSVLFYYNVIQRAVHTALLVFLLMISAFLAWHPVPLSRNLVLYCVGFALYFLSISLGMLALGLFGAQFTKSMNTVLLGISSGCLLLWLFTLRREEETRSLVLGPSADSATGENLLRAMNSLNSTLLRLWHK